MAEEKKKYNQHPVALPEKGDRTVTFRHKDFPDDASQNLEVLSTISADDIKRLEACGYEKVPGAKPRGPATDEDTEDEDDERPAPRKAPPTKKVATA